MSIQADLRPEEELAAGRAWVDEVMETLPNSTMKVLAVSLSTRKSLTILVLYEVESSLSHKANI
jgi:hypothetical protein